MNPADKEFFIRATHNTTSDGIRFIHELGGLPNPSLAIHKAHHAFDSMGEISLIAPLSLVDPKQPGVDVFEADIYSNRTPERRFETTARTRELIREIDQETRRLLGKERYAPGCSELEKGEDPSGIARTLATHPIGQALYLQSLGIVVEPKLTQPKYLSPAFGTPEVEAFFSNLTKPWASIKRGDPEFREYSDAVRRALQREYERAFTPEEVEDLLASIFDDDGLVRPGYVTYVFRDLELRNQGLVPDDTANEAEIERVMNELGPSAVREAARWWRERIRASYGAAYFLDTRGRKVPFTLENVSAEMLRMRDPRARETTLTFSPGKARAAGARKLRSLYEVTQLAGQLMSKEEIEAYKERQEVVRKTVADALCEHHVSAGSATPMGTYLNTLDDMHAAIAHVARRGAIDENSARLALERAGFTNVPSEVIWKFIEYAQLVLATPTQYFEVKIHRPVQLGEFAGAIVPMDTDDDVVEILRMHGLEIVFYPRRDSEARTAAFHELLNRPQIAASQRAICLPVASVPRQHHGPVRRRQRR